MYYVVKKYLLFRTMDSVIEIIMIGNDNIYAMAFNWKRVSVFY
jgi:hypothetical protein